MLSLSSCLELSIDVIKSLSFFICMFRLFIYSCSMLCVKVSPLIATTEGRARWDRYPCFMFKISMLFASLWYDFDDSSISSMDLGLTRCDIVTPFLKKTTNGYSGFCSLAMLLACQMLPESTR